MKYIVQFMVFLLLIVVGIYFGSENSEAIRIVVFGKLLEPLPVWFIVLWSFFIGAALAGIYFSFELVRLWVELKKLRKEMKTGVSIASRPQSSFTSRGGSGLGGTSTNRMSSTSFNPPSYSSSSRFGSSSLAGPVKKLP